MASLFLREKGRDGIPQGGVPDTPPPDIHPFIDAHFVGGDAHIDPCGIQTRFGIYSVGAALAAARCVFAGAAVVGVDAHICLRGVRYNAAIGIGPYGW